MAENERSFSVGSLVLRVAIALLVIVLYLSISTPRSQWEKHTENEAICRQHMENLYHASRYYNKMTKGFTDNIPELLQFARDGELTIHRAGIKMDRLTREESGIDSFIVDYFDPYLLFSHFKEEIEFTYPAGKDSIVLSIVPKERYADFLPPTNYIFTSNAPINARIDDRGEQGKYLLVGAQGKMNGRHEKPEEISQTLTVNAAKYVFHFPNPDEGHCHTTETEFNVDVNVKVAIQADLECRLNEELKDTVEFTESLISSDMFQSMVIFRWLKESDAKAKSVLVGNKTFETVEDSLIQAHNQVFLDSCSASFNAKGMELLAAAVYDTTLEEHELSPEEEAEWEKVLELSYAFMNRKKEDPKLQKKIEQIVNASKDSLAAENLSLKMEESVQKGFMILNESTIISTVADSIGFYSNPDLIKKTLFRTYSDSVTTSYLQRNDIKELLSRFNYQETYRVNRVDSVGVSIACPIEGRYVTKKKSLLERIFKVKGERNHGEVVNGDMSWSEKR